MSSQLAIGAVSAVLRNLLDNAMIDVGNPIGPVTVSAVAPDTIKLDDQQGGARLNLFLYRVSPNQGWHNARLPAFDGNGSHLASPPLALNLHYLLTAYGTADFQAEILLGYGMHLLHERPVLDRASIRLALDPSPLGPSILPPAFQAVSAADLADQLEAVTLTLEPMDTEEMSRLWSAIQSHYRPTAAYVASVVLIESTKPARAALPVLSRGPVDPSSGRDRGVVVEAAMVPPYPTIEHIDPPEPAQPAARLGDQVTLAGHHLDGTGIVVRFGHRLLDQPIEVAVGANADPSAINVKIPATVAAQTAWPAGVYTVSASVLRPGEAVARDTNVAAMLLAPQPTLPPSAIARHATTRAVTVTVGVKPRVRPSQAALLSLGGATAHADAHTAMANSLTFHFGDVDPGAQWARLTVDGVESLLVDRSVVPPTFDATQSVTVPA